MSFIKSIKKNQSEILALIKFQAPHYIYNIRYFKDIPVFCFHSVDYELFEKQLIFLKNNNYKTLNGNELLTRISDKTYKNNGSEIVLTFDDGMASVWTSGLPLLEKYDFNIILFVIPGLIGEGEPGKTLNDNLSPEEKSAALNRDYSDNPLCNWAELNNLNNSGLVDIQSHGMHHNLISVSTTIEDFIHPFFDKHLYGNITIPEYENDKIPKCMSREFVLGHPIYKSEPRLKGLPRYKDNLQLRDSCAKYVLKEGGKEFFKKANWKKDLYSFVESFQAHENNFETSEEVIQAISYELKESKRLIEKNIQGKIVDHFCFPWFQACELSASLAHEIGYKVIHLGATPGFSSVHNKSYPLFVTRLQEEYVLYLPGKGRISLKELLRQKKKAKVVS